jgi:hypothetical protein
MANGLNMDSHGYQPTVTFAILCCISLTKESLETSKPNHGKWPKHG